MLKKHEGRKRLSSGSYGSVNDALIRNAKNQQRKSVPTQSADVEAQVEAKCVLEAILESKNSETVTEKKLRATLKMSESKSEMFGMPKKIGYLSKSKFTLSDSIAEEDTTNVPKNN